ncbi:MAG TPA: AraC family transcriptional regulator [Clostridia bacterium]|nr:AraC family transcriptional regulator [Clostridia bacterium]
MTVNDLAKKIEGKVLSTHGDNEIKSGCACDLLSWVMARGSTGCAWITVQTHLNVIAIASLHDMACVIWPENVETDAVSLAKADEVGVAVISSPLSAYKIAGLMYEAGIEA